IVLPLEKPERKPLPNELAPVEELPPTGRSKSILMSKLCALKRSSESTSLLAAAGLPLPLVVPLMQLIEVALFFELLESIESFESDPLCSMPPVLEEERSSAGCGTVDSAP